MFNDIFSVRKDGTGIPISPSMGAALQSADMEPTTGFQTKRVLYIAAIAVFNAAIISIIAKALLLLINFITNISFYGKFSFHEASPLHHQLGMFVMAVPILGAIIIGMMARYGSKAIRGHGIPEAMEQVLTNKSKIKPIVTFLKPLSAAISIGTGGPFGAEGPIIATGGAWGSVTGQTLRISTTERKILLAAGAAAGMSCIFGTPLAAVILAIELLLFEYSPRSIVPVVLSCITGAAFHYLYFGSAPVFHMAAVEAPSNTALLGYSMVGLIIGLLSTIITKAIYFIEDIFEKLPIHWMWWPAIGAVAVGITGYFYPQVLGVGYENINDLLSGQAAVQLLVVLSLMKFIAWSISLGSGTSGGTLAPLLTMGGALGVLTALGVEMVFPGLHLHPAMAAVIGMAAMFAGASRAVLTSIIFALESTRSANALLPLVAACSAAYLVSFMLMKNSIMTEKIARRGIHTPDTYLPNVLQSIAVKEQILTPSTYISTAEKIGELRARLYDIYQYNLPASIPVVNDQQQLAGMIDTADLLAVDDPLKSISFINKTNTVAVLSHASLHDALMKLAESKQAILPVMNEANGSVIGTIDEATIFHAYTTAMKSLETPSRHISLKRAVIKTWKKRNMSQS
ncbi:H+/Cl- antiporter ClcA [Chitinophaga skermanii]|uniref:H+/Cl-antiporter ClcA n=1 Tax=Chitinophaga skermanii TaxID=331697 RepID=A0A327QJ30_9BACT|nr:chloride channel protein [Chitinophaga skermanii]RAJ01717.1 H+/Cl- antiporter ClcA [Chitinophaga skermanii]